MYRGLPTRGRQGTPRKPIGLETCRRAQVESLRAERFAPVPGVHNDIKSDGKKPPRLMPGVEQETTER